MPSHETSAFSALSLRAMRRIQQGPPLMSSLHRSREREELCGLRFEAGRGVAVAVVSSLERKRRQPGFATDDPEFIGWHQLVGGIQGPKVHADFALAAAENGRAAARAERAP